MEPVPPKVDPELPFAEARWVWRLARGLVGDDQAADDVVQETWVAALTHPPRSLPDQTALRAWLAAVARNFAHRARRAEARRETRERAAARAEETASVDRVAESESARRELVDAVLALDEPWRTTVVMRYFDELSSAEIARKIGVPESTVRNRLRRGLAELRTRLERDHGSQWKQRCLFLIPGAKLATAPSIGGGALAAGLFSGGSALVGLAALVLLAVLGWITRDGRAARDGTRRENEIAELERRMPLLDRATSPSPAVASSDRERASADTMPELDTSIVAELGHVGFGRVTGDDRGAPRDGQVRWTDSLGVDLEARLDDRGWYSIAGLRDGPWTVTVRAPGWRPAEALVPSRAEAALRCDVRLDRLAVIAVRLRTPSGQPIQELPEVRGPMHLYGLHVVATSTPPGARLDLVDQALPEEYGVGRFHGPGRLYEQGNVVSTPEGCIGVLEIAAPLPVHASLVLRDAVLETQLVQEGTHEITFTLASDAVESRLARAHVRVVDLAGNALPGVGVSLEPSQYYGATVTTDPEGRATIEAVPPGLCVLRAIAPGVERYSRFHDVTPGALLDLGTIRLGASVAVHGRVEDSRGAPVATTLCWFLLDDADRFVEAASWRHIVSSSSDGAFRLEDANQPPRARLLLRTERGQRGEVGWTVVDPAPGGVTEVLLRTAAAERVTLDLQPASDRRAWWRLRASGGVAIDAAPVGGKGPVALSLPAGAYELEMLEGTGVVRSERFVVGAGPQRIEVSW